MNLNPIIISALKPLGVPLAWMYYTGNVKPYMQFSVYDEYGSVFADDVETATNYYVQIDVFSETSPNTIAKQAREALEGAGFDHDRTRDFFETDTLLYHKVLTFTYYNESMEG